MTAFESACAWLKTGAASRPTELIDFRIPIINWYNTRIMNRCIGRVLDDRWATRSSRGKSKFLIDLAIETYLKENGGQTPEKLDAKFRLAATDQIKLLLFAGNDTSSSVICFALYYFAKRPDFRETIRKELQEVFGVGADIGTMIKQQPALLYRLEYLNAFIKEALRMHSPANTVRDGAPE